MSLKKNLLCLVLCSVIVTSLGVTAWAETQTSLGSTNKNIYAQYITETEKVYSVDIEWGDLSFVYTSSKGIWNPSTHSYSSPSNEWTPTENDGDLIIVTNHSNTNINITARVESISDYGSLSPVISNGIQEATFFLQHL